jgi:hypothetical protein
MVEAVASNGSSAASLAWEHRSDRSVTGGRSASAVREGGVGEVGEKESLAHQAPGKDQS